MCRGSAVAGPVNEASRHLPNVLEFGVKIGAVGSNSAVHVDCAIVGKHPVDAALHTGQGAFDDLPWAGFGLCDVTCHVGVDITRIDAHDVRAL